MYLISNRRTRITIIGKILDVQSKKKMNLSLVRPSVKFLLWTIYDVFPNAKKIGAVRLSTKKNFVRLFFSSIFLLNDCKNFQNIFMDLMLKCVSIFQAFHKWIFACFHFRNMDMYSIYKFIYTGNDMHDIWKRVWAARSGEHIPEIQRKKMARNEIETPDVKWAKGRKKVKLRKSIAISYYKHTFHVCVRLTIC